MTHIKTVTQFATSPFLYLYQNFKDILSSSILPSIAITLSTIMINNTKLSPITALIGIFVSLIITSMYIAPWIRYIYTNTDKPSFTSTITWTQDSKATLIATLKIFFTAILGGIGIFVIISLSTLMDTPNTLIKSIIYGVVIFYILSFIYYVSRISMIYVSTFDKPLSITQAISISKNDMKFLAPVLVLYYMLYVLHSHIIPKGITYFIAPTSEIMTIAIVTLIQTIVQIASVVMAVNLYKRYRKQ